MTHNVVSPPAIDALRRVFVPVQCARQVPCWRAENVFGDGQVYLGIVDPVFAVKALFP